VTITFCPAAKVERTPLKPSSTSKALGDGQIEPVERQQKDDGRGFFGRNLVTTGKHVEDVGCGGPDCLRYVFRPFYS